MEQTETPLSSEYVLEKQSIDPVLEAASRYDRDQVEAKRSSPEFQKQTGMDFAMHLISQGRPPEQAFAEVGIGDHDPTVPAGALDPTWLAADIITGGMTKWGSLARAGVEGATSSGFLSSLKEGLKTGFKTLSTPLSRQGAKTLAQDGAAREIVGEAAKQGAMGFAANASMDAAASLGGGTALQLLAGLGGPVFAEGMMSVFRRGGVSAMKAFAGDLRKNNPELLTQLEAIAKSTSDSVEGLGKDVSGMVDESRALLDRQASQAANEGEAVAGKIKTDIEAGLARYKEQLDPKQLEENEFSKVFRQIFMAPPEQRQAVKQAREEVLKMDFPESPKREIPPLGEGAKPTPQATPTPGELTPQGKADLTKLKKARDIVQQADNPPQRDVESLLKEGDPARVARMPEDASLGVREGTAGGEGEDAARGVLKGQAGGKTAEVVPEDGVAPSQPSSPSIGVPLDRQAPFVPRFTKDVEGLKTALMSGDLESAEKLIDFNPEKIEGPEELKKYLATGAKHLQDAMTQVTGGVEPMKVAIQRAEKFGLDDVVKTYAKTGQLDSHVFASLLNLNASADAAMKAVEKALTSKSFEDLALADHAIDLFSQMTLMAKGIQTSVGRSLNIYKAMRHTPADKADLLLNLVESRGGVDLFHDKLRVLYNLRDDPKALAKQATASTYTRWRNAFIEMTYANMLSSPSTVAPVFGVNSVGNAITLLQHLTEKMLASHMGSVGVTRGEWRATKQGIADALRIRSTQEAADEARPLRAFIDSIDMDEEQAKGALHGLLNSLPDAIQIALKAFKTESPVLDPVTKMTQEVAFPRAISAEALQLKGAPGLVADWAGKGLRLWTRTMLGVDEFSKALAFSGEFRAQAYRQAVREGFEDEALRQRYLSLVQTPSPEMVKEAWELSRYVTLQKDLESSFGKWVQAGRYRFPLAGALLVPFFKTGVNVIKWNIERTPGVSLVLKSARGELFSKDPAVQQMAMAKMATGTMVWLSAISAISSGSYTGSAPTDPETRKLWEAAGNKEHCFRVGDKLIPVNRLDPIAFPFTVASSVVQMSHDVSKTPDDLNKAMGVLFGTIYHFMGDRLYLQGISQWFDMLRDFEHNSGKPLKNVLTTTIVPWTSLQKGLRKAHDPVIREAWGAIEAIKNSTPFSGSAFSLPQTGIQAVDKNVVAPLNNPVPPARTILGEPQFYDPAGMKEADWKNLLTHSGLFTLLSPSVPGQARTDDVYQEMARLADTQYLTKRQLRQRLEYNGQTLELTHQQFDKLVSYMNDEKTYGGQTAKQLMKTLIESDVYKSLPSDMAKAEMVERRLTMIQRQAVGRFVGEHPEVREQLFEKKLEGMKEFLGQ